MASRCPETKFSCAVGVASAPSPRRRTLVKSIAALVGSVACQASYVKPSAAEPPLETTRIRLVKSPGLCTAPQYIAEELLLLDGFTDVEYIPEKAELGTSKLVATGEADMNMSFAAPLMIRVEAGEPIVMLGGVHVGCYELFGTNKVRAIRDLKGKRVAVPGLGSSHHLYLSSMISYVGLDPRRDIEWVTATTAEAMQLLADGRVDAYLAFAPDPQEMRAKHIGHVVVNSTLDKPWSQYFCCMVAGNREFVKNHPVATKRAMRAILKAADLCAGEPKRVARFLVDHNYVKSYDLALQTMQEISYRKWRDYNPEDTVRFYSLRLQEAGMIKSTPQKIIAQGTDWRFLNELKQELKA
jgi:NitT/TauT family transport system substrate-binding protein